MRLCWRDCLQGICNDCDKKPVKHVTEQYHNAKIVKIKWNVFRTPFELVVLYLVHYPNSLFLLPDCTCVKHDIYFTRELQL